MSFKNLYDLNDMRVCNGLTKLVAVEISTLQLLPISGVLGPERSVFQPTVFVSLVIRERSTTLGLLLGTGLGTVTKTLSFKVPKVSSPIVDIIFHTHLELP